MKGYIPVYPDLAGKVALITGGSGGIGATTCQLLAANGAEVAVKSRNEAKIDAAVGAIQADGGQAIVAAADVTDVTDFPAIERMRQRVEKELGPVEMLAVFAASGGPPPGPTAQITEEEWQSAIDANLTSTFLTLKSFLPTMIERGSGSIVTMDSSAGRVLTPRPNGLRGGRGGGGDARRSAITGTATRKTEPHQKN
jgi:3-oxoacyl-[acyl-carrier protein] reductase